MFKSIFDINNIDANDINVKNVFLNMCVKPIGYVIH